MGQEQQQAGGKGEQQSTAAADQPQPGLEPQVVRRWMHAGIAEQLSQQVGRTPARGIVQHRVQVRHSEGLSRVPDQRQLPGGLLPGDALVVTRLPGQSGGCAQQEVQQAGADQHQRVKKGHTPLFEHSQSSSATRTLKAPRSSPTAKPVARSSGY